MPISINNTGIQNSAFLGNKVDKLWLGMDSFRAMKSLAENNTLMLSFKKRKNRTQ